MTGILANLSRDGLLSREADPSHGRILRSELTSLGKKLLSQAHLEVGVLEKTMVKAVGHKRAAQLTGFLSQLADDLALKEND